MQCFLNKIKTGRCSVSEALKATEKPICATFRLKWLNDKESLNAFRCRSWETHPGWSQSVFLIKCLGINLFLNSLFYLSDKCSWCFWLPRSVCEPPEKWANNIFAQRSTPRQNPNLVFSGLGLVLGFGLLCTPLGKKYFSGSFFWSALRNISESVPAGLFRGWRVASNGWRVADCGWRVPGGG